MGGGIERERGRKDKRSIRTGETQTSTENRVAWGKRASGGEGGQKSETREQEGDGGDRRNADKTKTRGQEWSLGVEGERESKGRIGERKSGGGIREKSKSRG